MANKYKLTEIKPEGTQHTQISWCVYHEATTDREIDAHAKKNSACHTIIIYLTKIALEPRDLWLRTCQREEKTTALLMMMRRERRPIRRHSNTINNNNNSVEFWVQVWLMARNIHLGKNAFVVVVKINIRYEPWWPLTCVFTFEPSIPFPLRSSHSKDAIGKYEVKPDFLLEGFLFSSNHNIPDYGIKLYVS